MDEVEHIIKKTVRITDRPVVQFRLHRSYPHGCLLEVRPNAVHRYSPVAPFLAVATASYPLGPFAMCEAFPRSDYYGPSAPSYAHRRTTHPPEPAPPDGATGRGAARWFPRSLLTDRQVRRPAMPLRYRHGYAAGLHRGLEASDLNPTPKFPPRNEVLVRIAGQPKSTGLELAGDLRSFRHWFLSYAFLPCLPDPDHPVVLVRPGVVGAACHPHRRLPGQAAPSFVMLLRQHNGEGLSPPLGNTAPRGAPGRLPSARARPGPRSREGVRRS